MIVDEEHIKDLIIPRSSSSHKGDNGIVGIVGGSRLYHGAPLLSALGALRSGSDLAYLFVPEVITSPIRASAPDIIVYSLPDSKFTVGTSNKILNFRKNINSYVIGPGIVNQKMNGLIKLVSELQKKDKKIILDAGAINKELLDNISGNNIIITAHLGEFNKLVNKKIDGEESIKNEVIDYAKNHKLTLVVKGKTDYISDGKQIVLNKSGNSSMTKGGTGDILSGIIASQVSMGSNSLDASILGTYFMGKTGEIVYEKWGFQYMASEFLIELAKYIKQYNKIS
tara:strand:- start:13884 stop:14732 length:849 start_codon:yes stop_codon:yes gene_type:complete